MPDNLPSMIMFALSASLMVLILWKNIRNLLAPVRRVRARVVDKNKVEFYSKTASGGKGYRYAVVFEVEGKKKSFYVSEFSYRGYRQGEQGKLTYKGDRLIGFE